MKHAMGKIVPLTRVSGLGEALRAARKRQGLTQEELAGLAGVGLRFVSDLERGKETVQLGLALKVTRLLGLELAVVERRDLARLSRALGSGEVS